MKRFFKKPLCQLLLIVCLAALAVGLLVRPSTKASTFRTVRKNQAELEALAEAVMEAGEAQGYAFRGYRIEYEESNRMVQFTTSGSGLGASTSYRGFYYSPADIPLGFQGTDVPFVPSGDGWHWQEPDGDNWEYTEKIMDHWYWFEMHF